MFSSFLGKGVNQQPVARLRLNFLPLAFLGNQGHEILICLMSRSQFLFAILAHIEISSLVCKTPPQL